MRAIGVLAVVRILCVLGVIAALTQPLFSHDLERTQVVLTFARDGSFILDVSNDPNWLRDRMQSIPGPFADRVVLWVDGHEVRPESVELIQAGDMATHRLRGRMPIDAKTLRWYYGLVIDPYALVVHRADGRIVIEEIAGGAWSGTIELAGQFRRASPLPGPIASAMLIFAVLIVPPIAWLWRIRR